MKKKRSIIIVSIILFILVTATAVFYSFNSKDPLDSTNKTNTSVLPTQNTIEMLKTEETIRITIDETAKNYIIQTYPESSEITLQTEIVGRGYGIINASFLLNENQTQRKIYLKESNSNWSVIEESENQISCDTIKALNDPESMLFSFCQ